MDIKVDDEARGILMQWSDIVLRAQGVNALNSVQAVLRCIADKKKDKEKTDEQSS